jgi:hypothetical protein
MDELVIVWVKRSIKNRLLQKKIELNLKNINEVIIKLLDGKA